MHVGQATINTIAAEGELGVVDAHQVQHCGMDVVDLSRVVSIQRLVAPLIGWAVSDAGLDAAAAHPVAEDIRIVVTTFAALSMLCKLAMLILDALHYSFAFCGCVI